EFIREFWKAQNSLSVDVFEQQFQSILEKYFDASAYLQSPIYSTRQSWACSFVNRIFTAGMQSTQRVESINALVHKEVSSSSSMTDVVEAIDSRMQKEVLNMYFMSWKHKTLTYHQPFIIERFFNNVKTQIHSYLSLQITKELYNQMCESVLYHCKKIEFDIAVEFNEDYLDQIEYNEDISEFNENQMDMDQNVEAIEDYYDFHQTYLKALINSIPVSTIKEVWRIILYISENSYQHIILLDDENSNTLFHVMLMPTRWFQDDLWKCLDAVSKEPFIGVPSKNVQDGGSMQKVFPRHYNNIQEAEIRCRVQKKAEYEAESQITVIRDQTSSVRLIDSRVYNVDDIKDPVIRQGKGRQATKCLKAFNEESSKASSKKMHWADIDIEEKKTDDIGARKCRLCHKTGHHAPKCPNTR
ncbi:21773_t:CDS:2, partial [Gigaspora rosea]